MSIQNLLSQFTSSPGQTQEPGGTETAPNPLASITSSIPGGLAGGAAAGGVMALLMGNKSTRKMMGSVAKIGGTALVGGLAYKAYSNWKQGKPLSQTGAVTTSDIGVAQTAIPEPGNAQSMLTLTLIKAMISAAKSDGQFDSKEQNNIYQAVEKMGLSPEDKAVVFDAMTREISVQELAESVSDDHHKAEVYLSAYLAIEVDEQKERDYLNSLAAALALPKGLPVYLEEQAQRGLQ